MKLLLDFVVLFTFWNGSVGAVGAFPGSASTNKLPRSETTLRPGQQVKIDLGVGKSLRVPFNCTSGIDAFGADAMIHLESLFEHSDPFLVVSSDEKVTWVGTTSFEQWRDDAQRQSIVVKNLGPQGGTLDVYNINSLATESLKADLSIHCALITAYDFLFWDHIKDKEVCPIGTNNKMCSGRGECKNGVCDCDGAQGIACDHLRNDIVMARGSFNFHLPNGKYHFYRVQVPPTFPGGYLEVSVKSDYPLVIVIRHNEPPTKADFDQSNFGDWLRHENSTLLQFAVPPGPQAHSGPHEAAAEQRRMQLLPLERPSVQCPDLDKLHNSHPSCSTPKVKRCELECLTCIECVEAKGSACRFLCQGCSHCADDFLPCAEKLHCQGSEAKLCERSCGSCMGCLDANDPNCASCGCCGACLPWAAKCGALSRAPIAPIYIFVGVYNHRFYYTDKQNANVKVDVELHDDPAWKPRPPDWVEELYGRGPLQTIEAVQQANDNYGGRHVYTLNEVPGTIMIDVYRDRVTLVHVRDFNLRTHVEARVSSDVALSHMLVSSARPKTLFDFTNIASKDNGMLKAVFQQNPSSMWYAIFAHENGKATLTVTSTYSGASSFPFTTTVFLVSVCTVVYFVVQARNYLSSHSGSLHEVEPLQHRLQAFTLSPTSAASNFRYPSFREEDPVSSSVEAMHMHRGGTGADDGI